MDLALSVEAQGPTTIAHVGGELDAHTAPRLRKVLHELTAQGHLDVVVDMRELSFVDSTGLGVLVGALKRQRVAGGTLRLAGLTDGVLKVFRITGLDTVFDVVPDPDALGQPDKSANPSKA